MIGSLNYITIISLVICSCYQVDSPPLRHHNVNYHFILFTKQAIFHLISIHQKYPNIEQKYAFNFFYSESPFAVECSVLAFASNARLSFVYNKNSNHQHVCFCQSNLQEPTLHEKKPAFDCLFIVLVVTGFFTQPLYLTIFIPTIHR